MIASVTATWVWFGLVLRHINHCWLFNAKSSLNIYIKYIGFGLVWFLWHIKHCRLFNVKSPLSLYLSLSLYIYIYNWVWLGFMAYQPLLFVLFQTLFIHIHQIYKIWFGLVLWHINHCWLFYSRPSSYIYIKYIWFGLVWFYGISTIAGYLMPNPLYTYITYMISKHIF